jgi:antitoxin component YwqK of YwqJK toxin-antitoxin module
LGIPTQKDFKYIQIIKDYLTFKKEPYEVQEYYTSGKIAAKYSIVSNFGFTKTGSFISYYENGSRKSIKNYQEGSVFGLYFDFYENGKNKLEAEDIFDTKSQTITIKINQFWDSDGVQKVVDGNGYFDSTNKYGFEKGEVKNGFKVGPWEGMNRKVSYKEIYDNGKLISGVSTDESGESFNYNVPEVKPEAKGGMEDFYDFVARNFVVPEITGLQGTIFLKFVIEKDGSVTDIKVLRDIGYGTGAEAVRVLQRYENWKPGMRRGIKERCSFGLPITIQNVNQENH